ncbi:PREDICTED: tachykinin-like peptides receptor 99D, partial [Rhagoletis zephyria]|uniref:tachykinin-like peptides receptor 99D n=1 Tax=Rhagoletis zephyria TaxID=28612 RepID=UPI000811A823
MSSPLVTSLYGILSPSSNGGSTLPLNSIAASLSAASSTLSMGTEGAVSSTVPTTTSTLAADGLITTLTTLVSGDPNCTVSSIISTASMSPDYEQEQQDHNIYIMPLFTQIIWSFIFGSMIFVAAGGNIIVIWIVLTHKRMRTVTNYFLVNLSLADTMVALLNVLENFIYMLNGDWPFGEMYCKVSNFVAILSVAASVFTLMAISIDRYLAIVHPLRPRMSRTMTLNIIVCIWICSSLLSLPNIIYSTTLLESFRNGDSRVICYLEWYDGPSTKSRMEYIYNILILLVTYMLPIVSMSYTYFRVGKELWGSQSIGECTAKQMESIKSKRKIVKMMMIVVAIFGICWFPYHVYFLLAHHYPSIVSSEYAQHTYLSIYWLAMSNSMYNPFVYCWMNSRFRQGFKNIFCCTCLRQKDQNMFDKPR